MPDRPASKSVLSLTQGGERADTARRVLLADWCRLVGRRLGGEPEALSPAAPSSPPGPAAAVAALGLPPRASQILAGLLAGGSEKQIALSLSISPHTVHTHVKQLHKRLNVSSRGELLARFIGPEAGHAGRGTAVP